MDPGFLERASYVKKCVCVCVSARACVRVCMCVRVCGRFVCGFYLIFLKISHENEIIWSH